MMSIDTDPRQGQGHFAQQHSTHRLQSAAAVGDDGNYRQNNQQTQPPYILIVDDTPANLVAMKAVLKPLDVDVRLVSSGQEAITAICERIPSLVIMDVQMPGMNGFETTQLIHENEDTRHVPVIFVTAINKDTHYVKMGYEHGAVDYVQKPIDNDIFLAKVKVFLKLEQQKADLIREKESNFFLYLKQRMVLDAIGEGVIGMDQDGVITTANPEACKILKMSLEELEGEHIQKVLPPDCDWLTSPIHKALEQNSEIKVDDAYFCTVNHTQVPVSYCCKTAESQQIDFHGGVVAFQDITERKLAEQKLVKMSRTDPLTELGNRNLFNEYITAAVSRADRANHRIGLILLDIDRFKIINDRLGHDVGDALLQEIALRLKQITRSNDAVCRLGGDEFAVVLDSIKNDEDISIIIDKIMLTLCGTYLINRQEVSASVSVGVALYPTSAADVAGLIKAADIALYNVKEHGRNDYSFYSAELHQRRSRRTEIESELRDAIKNHELTVYYQPKYHCLNQCICGFEALIRWNNPALGWVPPDEFIPIAESVGLIQELGQYVLEKTTADLQGWMQSGLTAGMSIAINVSAKQLSDLRFANVLIDTLKRKNLSANLIEVEVTETSFIESCDSVMANLTCLSDAGIKIALDDFGTGYSSLSYLTQFPVDIVKIDKSFTQKIGSDRGCEAVIKAIIAMADSLDMEVIAEGVETAEHVEFMTLQQCGFLQGYFLSRPIPFDKATQLLIDHLKN